MKKKRTWNKKTKLLQLYSLKFSFLSIKYVICIHSHSFHAVEYIRLMLHLAFCHSTALYLCNLIVSLTSNERLREWMSCSENLLSRTRRSRKTIWRECEWQFGESDCDYAALGISVLLCWDITASRLPVDMPVPDDIARVCSGLSINYFYSVVFYSFLLAQIFSPFDFSHANTSYTYTSIDMIIAVSSGRERWRNLNNFKCIFIDILWMSPE